MYNNNNNIKGRPWSRCAHTSGRGRPEVSEANPSGRDIYLFFFFPPSGHTVRTCIYNTIRYYTRETPCGGCAGVVDPPVRRDKVDRHIYSRVYFCFFFFLFSTPTPKDIFLSFVCPTQRGVGVGGGRAVDRNPSPDDHTQQRTLAGAGLLRTDREHNVLFNCERIVYDARTRTGFLGVFILFSVCAMYLRGFIFPMLYTYVILYIYT